jgi:hypothetical protein
MASTFTTVPGNSIKGFLGKEIDVPIYLQFVPGYVVEAVHSSESLRYGGDNTINSIIALPHISDKAYKRRSSAGEEYRYYPLFRSITDVPSKGDPVLLCTIGNTRYYLGPLNTQTNNPTWNNDPSFKPEQLIGKNVGNVTIRGLKGESPNFNKEELYKRLIKIRKEELDYGNAIRETTGDTIIEGRHGNSIRVGSRSNNPYIFVSNERNPQNDTESIVDGSLISITSNGTLEQHFGGYEDIVNEVSVPGFILASDNITENKRLMSNLIGSLNNLDDSYPEVYGYDGNQILFNSDRIIINSKLNDMYLSSNRDIHIGTGRTVTISTNKNLIIESEKTYLGDPNKKDNENKMEHAVLGDKLLEVLQDLVNALEDANGLVQGVPVPLTDKTGAPGSFGLKITPIGEKLTSILSQYHYIEPNKGNK